MYKAFSMNWKQNKSGVKNRIKILMESKAKEIYGVNHFEKKASDNATYEQMIAAAKAIQAKLKKQGIQYRITVFHDFQPKHQSNSKLFTD
jgi:hypothetical protein